MWLCDQLQVCLVNWVNDDCVNEGCPGSWLVHPLNQKLTGLFLPVLVGAIRSTSARRPELLFVCLMFFFFFFLNKSQNILLSVVHGSWSEGSHFHVVPGCPPFNQILQLLYFWPSSFGHTFKRPTKKGASDFFYDSEIARSLSWWAPEGHNFPQLSSTRCILFFVWVHSLGQQKHSFRGMLTC